MTAILYIPTQVYANSLHRDGLEPSNDSTRLAPLPRALRDVGHHLPPHQDRAPRPWSWHPHLLSLRPRSPDPDPLGGADRTPLVASWSPLVGRSVRPLRVWCPLAPDVHGRRAHLKLPDRTARRWRAHARRGHLPAHPPTRAPWFVEVGGPPHRNPRRRAPGRAQRERLDQHLSGHDGVGGARLHGRSDHHRHEVGPSSRRRGGRRLRCPAGPALCPLGSNPPADPPQRRQRMGSGHPRRRLHRDVLPCLLRPRGRGGRTSSHRGHVCESRSGRPRWDNLPV